MSRSGRPAILLAALLAAARAEALQGVHGMVHGEDRDDPVPGALVVLYDSDELLVDFTYSRDDGGFTLRPPPRPGPASVVATVDGRAHRQEIRYDPARNRRVWIPLPAQRESRLKQAAAWVLDELGAVIGLLVGYGFRVLVEERGGAKRKRDDFLSDLRGLADRALNASGIPAAAEVTRMRQFVERREDDMKDALSTLSLVKKAEARAGFDSLRKQVADTEALLTGPFKSDVDREEKLEQARKNLAAIHRLRLG